VDPNRKLWNEQQQALRQTLVAGDQHRAVALFLSQHAMLHASELESQGPYSFDDELWGGLSDTVARRIPHGEEHSIAWAIWHIARIEDLTMNLLLAGEQQLLEQEGWARRMQVPDLHTGNAMDAAAIAKLSAEIDLAALRLYRLAVARRTRQLVPQLTPADFKHKVDPKRLEHALAIGAVEPAAAGLLDYWGGLTLSGLLLMPPTRHNLVHLNEAIRLKARRA
jgi:hypothetical protein